MFKLALVSQFPLVDPKLHRAMMDLAGCCLCGAVNYTLQGPIPCFCLRQNPDTLENFRESLRKVGLSVSAGCGYVERIVRLNKQRVAKQAGLF